MNDFFKINLQDLKDGNTKTIDASISPSFMEIEEKDLIFKKNIQIKGKYYLTNDHLIINLNVATEPQIRCKVCNELTAITLSIKNFYHAEPLSDIKNNSFDYKKILRETILLEIPSYVECNDGNCPQRKIISKYLKKPSNEDHYPFTKL